MTGPWPAAALASTSARATSRRCPETWRAPRSQQEVPTQSCSGVMAGLWPAVHDRLRWLRGGSGRKEASPPHGGELHGNKRNTKQTVPAVLCRASFNIIPPRPQVPVKMMYPVVHYASVLSNAFLTTVFFLIGEPPLVS